MHMVVNPYNYLPLNEEVNITHLLEESEFQILLMEKKLFMTRVFISIDEVQEMKGLVMLSPDVEEEKYIIAGVIVVPSGTREEAMDIIEEREFDEELIGVLTSIGGFTYIPTYN